MARRPSRRAAALVVPVALSLVLAGCGGSDEPEQPAAEDSASASPSAGSTVAVPEGVALTDAGTELDFGETATVVHEPDQKRGSVVEVTVTGVREARMAAFSAYTLDEQTLASSPYFVDVTVENVGETDLGGAPVPLWAVDERNQLVQASTFSARFEPCASTPLPAEFAPGASVETCLVYLLPDAGVLRAVSFRPSQEVEPITWTGEVTPAKPARKKRSRNR
ncbi:hypothetical protein [Nocardioides massiliensis]|uniref:DUF4352 domain-containing protein n=1 Tax=Nocardioides massiliensis TaxID=1325935 RepID=A0ABT9NPU8_9ACTN|nr:hypothetical protein [Nocardioides massiliensis]MDP9822458.1 hypothetical protein [Nocardioides massiliensis]